MDLFLLGKKMVNKEEEINFSWSGLLCEEYSTLVLMIDNLSSNDDAQC